MKSIVFKEVKIFTLLPTLSSLSSQSVITDLLSPFLSITEIHSNLLVCMYDIQETKVLFRVPYNWEYELITCLFKCCKHACQIHFPRPTNCLVYIVLYVFPNFVC